MTEDRGVVFTGGSSGCRDDGYSQLDELARL